MKLKQFIILFLLVNINVFANNKQKILNLLKESTQVLGSHGRFFPAGYHTLKLGKDIIKGRRDPYKRISLVPYDFKNKTVLDLGCNAGGMLLALANKIKFGVGIDYNYYAINAANKLKSYNKTNNIDFFYFDLEKHNLDKIKNFLSKDKVDICFMLSLCNWVKNWKEVATFTASISNALLFEAHGREDFQNNQISYIRTLYRKVNLISKNSNDDPALKNRKLYLCLK